MMKVTMFSFLVLCVVALPRNILGADPPKPTDQNIAAIMQAVEDEIYDYGYEEDFTNIGSTGAIGSPTQVPIFISPVLYNESHGVVIYKYMPFGEVQRRFEIRPDGLAVLFGKPENHFPATQPDTNTLYLNDDDVCSFKQKAIRASFTIDPSVALSRRKEGAKRQLLRVNYSQFEEHQKKRNGGGTSK
jgi:hypothetical protein